ncbi:RNA helicase [Rhizoctonia solani AG-3 Rhs1AP]|uniref:RNA helicase n=1 Tax=Rhizoctonia solani AG-3 Rhs1AP TaxID=1086054 RepID=X8JJW3_9AGAM|nr:RNA helicase [Rhizoctonia solani AG-3 Rhs1AP]
MPILCEICSVTLSGPVVQAAHIAGRRHRVNAAAQGTSQPPSNGATPRPAQQRSRGRGAPRANPTAPVGSRPQGFNATDLNQFPSTRGLPARRGRGAPRPQPQIHGSAPNSSHFDRSDTPPQRGIRGRGRGGYRGRGRGAPAGSRASPPRETNNAGTGPPLPVRRDYAIDFGVIPNMAPTRQQETCDLHIPEAELVRGPTVRIVPIKPSRKLSVNGFSFLESSLSEENEHWQRYTLTFEFNPGAVTRGVHVVRAIVKYTPSGQRPNQKYLKLRAIIGSPEDHQTLQPSAPFKPMSREELKDDWHKTRLIQEKPTQNTLDFRRLDYYDVPPEFWNKAQSFVEKEKDAEFHLRSLLPYELNVRTYKQHWSHFLWHEEIAMCNQLKQYDMQRITIDKLPNGKYSLHVPGLEEKRPSVIVSDLVAIRRPSLNPNSRAPVYGGYVTEVQRSEVIMQLHGEFPHVVNQEWETRFTVNRLVLRRMHDAISKATVESERLLFPEESHKKPRASLSTRLSIDRRISTNERQRLAVEQIVALGPGDIPFIIFGPPGTGKTTVVVEAIHQVAKTHPESYLLVCAPSNSAADLLATRLAQVYPRSQLLRLNAPTRSFDALPVGLRKYSALESNGKTFTAPSSDDLKKFRIIVSTCFYASVPIALGIENHFTHVFVDEAGHASESEIMIPILQNASPTTNVIISGDPKQLGPIIQSKACNKLGMSVSFLERMTQRTVYRIASGDHSGSNIVKLLQNYRNHPAILRFSNIVFYGGELQACADPVVWSRLMRFDKLPQPGFPVIFHSICGENQREGKSPSYFNIDEATLVKHYVRALIDEGSYGLNSNLIGVITPYRQQCVKIQQLLNKVGYGGVEVKVTEDWQGQEKRVIIISTVRSDPELLEEGALKFLGFVTSPRRTNVALTRAQALVIVIGNGPVLLLDPFWNSFIRYVHASGGCAGDDLEGFIQPQGDYGPGIFADMRRENEDYMERIDQDDSWGALRRASQSWDSRN